MADAFLALLAAFADALDRAAGSRPGPGIEALGELGQERGPPSAFESPCGGDHEMRSEAALTI
ncbi:hypothetical protein PUR57_13570 [Streptomyces sp. JV176]|uniref:hypothetical protein n=1 Tax=Streptomyces sp. JV176 TaxID=858630 RepID=UPI002E773CE1|nr:hypothetical protein [Streptomyces sp. JV176]MEE1799688.1 hypothetical protein [Streptomyces sp. JV176]